MKKIHSKEFKETALELSYNSDKTISELSKELGIHENMLYKWRRDQKENPLNAFSGKGTPEQEEIKKLKKELANLEVQNQIQTLRVNHHLKKALAICNRM